MLDLPNAYSPALLWYAAHFGSSGSAFALTHHANFHCLERMGKKSASPIAPHGTISFLPLCRAETSIGKILPKVNEIFLLRPGGAGQRITIDSLSPGTNSLIGGTQ